MIEVFQAANSASKAESVQFNGKSYLRVKPADFVGRDSFNFHVRSVFSPEGPGLVSCACGVGKGCGYALATCGLMITLVGIPAALCLLHTSTRLQQHHVLLRNGFQEIEGTDGQGLVSVQGPWLIRAFHLGPEKCICEPVAGGTKASFVVERFIEEGHKEMLSWPEYWKQHLQNGGNGMDETQRVQMMEDFDTLWNPNSPNRLEEQKTITFAYGPIAVGVKGKVAEE